MIIFYRFTTQMGSKSCKELKRCKRSKKKAGAEFLNMQLTR